MAPFFHSPHLVRNLALAAELERLARAFRREGVDLVVLKGVPLTRRLYGRLDARTMLDNDLLVRRADASRAHDLLVGLGYADLPFASFEGALRHGHEFAMLRARPGSHPLVVDLHWAPWSPRRYAYAEEAVWSRTEEWRAGTTPVLVFDPALTLVHLAAHYAQHCFAVGQILSDVAAAWERWHGEIDPVDLSRLARRCGHHHALGYALSVANHRGLVDAPPPPGMSVRARALARLRPLGRDHGDPGRYDLTGLLLSLSLSTPRRALKGAARLAFPPPSQLGAIYQRPSSRLLYLRYLFRPARPFARLLRLPPP